MSSYEKQNRIEELELQLDVSLQLYGATQRKLEQAMKVIRSCERAWSGSHAIGDSVVRAAHKVLKDVDGRLPACNCTPCAKARKAAQ